MPTVPSYIANLKAYSSAKSEKQTGTVWLNANESPQAPTLTLSLTALNRYPEPQPPAVIARYAEYLNCSQDNVLMTRGADEGIELLVRSYCQPGRDSIAIFAPTYGMYKVTADTHNVAVSTLSQTLLLSQEPELIAKQVQQCKLVFICNPNNPTGQLIDVSRIEAIARALNPDTLLVVDEAYIEFCPEQSALALTQLFSNVVLTRTLSKAFGLAGLRCGFVIADAQTLAPLRKVQAPYPIAGVVADLVAQALTPEAITTMRNNVAMLNDNRTGLTLMLEHSGFSEKVLPSNGNFVCAKLSNRPAFLAKAKNFGLVVRSFDLYGEPDWVRISVGSSDELQVVAQVLEELQ